MDETYDIWINYGYDGWDYEFGLDHTSLVKTIDKCEQYSRSYFVYKTEDRQID